MILNEEKSPVYNSPFLIIGFIGGGSIMLTSYTSNITKHDTWPAVLVGFLIMVPFVYIYALLAKRLPERMNNLLYNEKSCSLG